MMLKIYYGIVKTSHLQYILKGQFTQKIQYKKIFTHPHVSYFLLWNTTFLNQWFFLYYWYTILVFIKILGLVYLIYCIIISWIRVSKL